ncbi:MAG TPA: hypothetical protein DIW46_09490 [Microbacterium sp.]|nr:hypothetical protein [Microbacterium sp.]
MVTDSEGLTQKTLVYGLHLRGRGDPQFGREQDPERLVAIQGFGSSTRCLQRSQESRPECLAQRETVGEGAKLADQRWVSISGQVEVYASFKRPQVALDEAGRLIAPEPFG